MIYLYNIDFFIDWLLIYKILLKNDDGVKCVECWLFEESIL